MPLEVTLISVAARKAYKQALQTLATLTSAPPSHTQGLYDASSNSFISSLFFNQHGPIASAMRILLKLRQQSWVPRFILAGKDGWLSGRRSEELRGKALKVIDLLEHAIELGHTEALFKLAQISMVSNQNVSVAQRTLGLIFLRLVWPLALGAERDPSLPKLSEPRRVDRERNVTSHARFLPSNRLQGHCSD